MPDRSSNALLRVQFVLTALAAGGVLGTIYLAFVVAPIEARMGIAQKIFYFHVPSAYSMYLGFVTAAVGGLMYLVKRDDKWDALGAAGAEVGMMFCAIVLVTGPLWARKAWGVYWTWDPRLTTTLLAGMVFSAYLVLRSAGDAGDVEKRFAAGLAVLGLINLPVIHYSVQYWRGVHPTVITKTGGGLDPRMGWALGVGFLAFTLLSVVLVWIRFGAERDRQRLVKLEREINHANR